MGEMPRWEDTTYSDCIIGLFVIRAQPFKVTYMKENGWAGLSTESIYELLAYSLL